MKSNIIKTLAAAALAGALASPILNAMTNEEKEYLNLYGMVVCEQSGAKQLGFNDEEMAAFIEGLKAYQAGKAFPENAAEIGPKMQAFLEQRAAKIMDEQLAKTKAENDAFWAKLKENKNVKFEPSGLGYEIIKQGEGLPKESSIVEVDYVGTLINGTEFDSSKKTGKPAKFPLAQVIPGFREGLQKIGKGGKIRLYIPAKLGYGNQAVGAIPAGSTLIFDVDMIGFEEAPAVAPSPMPAAEPINIDAAKPAEK